MTLLRFFRIARQRLRSLARKTELDAELERELALHFDQLVLENIAEGMVPSEARLAARRTLGNSALLQDQCRDQRRVNWFQDLRLDVDYGLRILRKSPVFTTVVVVSLALGIGANTAVLGVIDAVERDAVPLSAADRLVVIRRVALDNPGQSTGSSLADYLAWKDRSRAFDAMDVSLTGPRDIQVEESGVPAERITGQSVTPGLFSTLGVQPLRGRSFTEADSRPAAEQLPVVLISHRLWQDRYAGDPDILGRQIYVDRVRRTIVGVMSRESGYLFARVDCWIPMHVDPKQPMGAGRFFGITARLNPGVTMQQAQADLSAIAAQLARESPEHNKGLGVRVQPLHDALYGWTNEPLTTLFAAVALVLLVAGANVAGLLLSRTVARQREMAMRVALGAGRGRIIRQLLTESVLLALAGGAAGLLVAWGGVRGLVALSPPFGSPPIADMTLNLRILGVGWGLSIVTGLAFGLAPALVASRMDTFVPLNPSKSVGAADRGQLVRTALVAAQLALAVILLSAAGLLTKSFVRLAARDLNFDPAGLLTFEVRISMAQRSLGQREGFGYFEIESRPAETMKAILERLRSLPGAESVAGISYPPVDSLILPMMDVTLDGQAAARGDRRGLRAAYFLVTPNLFRTLRTPFVRGRDVDDRDTVLRPWVAIVNESAARLFWPHENPIGRYLTLDVVPDEQPREVVGVVPDIPVRHGQVGPQPVIYTSYLQQPSRYRGPFGGMFAQMTFLMRSAGDPLALVPAARRAVAEVEPNRPISAILTAAERRRFGNERRRYYVFLVGVLAFTAAVLAAVGVYGVMAYSISQRTREIGIRKALGAGTRDVVMLVGRRILVLVVIGLIAGSAAALTLSRLIASQLWGTAPTDPATYASVALLVIAVALLACLGPIRRAIGIDPTVALRCE